MNSTLILVIITVVAALAFDLINGFHDTANAIATAVSTRALKLRTAIVLASIMNFLGALSFSGVAKTISKDILADPYKLHNGGIVIICALVSAISWNLLTWYFGLPSSSSHTLIGSLAGAAIAAAGFQSIQLEGFLKILKALIMSPFLAFIVGFIILSVFKLMFKKMPMHKMNNGFRKTQILTVCLQAYTHGTNDAQKSMGIITLALMATQMQTGNDIQLWVKISCALAMTIGTSIGGWRIIKTVGTKIMKIRPISGVSSDLASAAVIFGASHFGLPVSTTHVISSAIMGVGTAYRPRSVKWETAKRIVATWIITIPISAVIAGLLYALVSFVLGV